MGTIEVVATCAAGRKLVPACRRFLHRLLHDTHRAAAGVTLLLASDATVRRLNRQFLRKDRATDVLSFPSGGDLEPGCEHLGEIAVSVPQAARQARRAGWSLREEAALLITHGFLHLLGYDHETDDGTMRRLEEILLRRSGIVLARRRLPWGGVASAGTRRCPGSGRRRRAHERAEGR